MRKGWFTQLVPSCRRSSTQDCSICKQVGAQPPFLRKHEQSFIIVNSAFLFTFDSAPDHHPASSGSFPPSLWLYVTFTPRFLFLMYFSSTHLIRRHIVAVSVQIQPPANSLTNVAQRKIQWRGQLSCAVGTCTGQQKPDNNLFSL